MLENNVNNFSEGKQSPIDIKTETTGYHIIEEVEDNAIRRIYVQKKALKCHAAKLKQMFNYELKEANDEKVAQKEAKDQFFDLQKCIDKTVLKLATLKSSAHLNMQWLR